MRALPFLFLLASTGATHASEICATEQKRLVHIGPQTFDVSVAVSPSERERGLSGRRELAAQSGLWFEFDAPGWHAFWMDAMQFPIDLVWVSPDRLVLGAITLHPCTETCRIYLPPSPVSYVLEVNAGEFTGQAGDPVTWSCAPY